MSSEITSIKEEGFPSQLFHYTSMQGLLGIINGKQIWATNLAYVNDKSEFIHARDMFITALSKLWEEIEKSEDEKTKHAAKSINGYLGQPETKTVKISFVKTIIEVLQASKKGYPYYVVSFSEEPDQLSQWRGYCQNTYGFSMGFNYSKLKERADKSKFKFSKCIYDPEMQSALVNNFIKEQIEPNFDKLTESTFKDIGVKTVIDIWSILPVLKNESFQEEKEWRLICFKEDIPKNVIQFRPGKTVLIPYYEFKLADEGEELPIDSITIGPTPNQIDSRVSLRFLLNTTGVASKANIKASIIPYREI
jgi:hypothetical protein